MFVRIRNTLCPCWHGHIDLVFVCGWDVLELIFSGCVYIFHYADVGLEK